MTARTIAYLNGTLLSSGQTAGSITPARMQDIVDTLQVRTGNGVQNLVIDPEYGADPTGFSDSTAAFAAALAGGATALVPPGTYRLNNLVVPTNGSIIGYAPIGYGQGTTPLLVALNSSTVRLINVSGATNVRLSGVQLDADYSLNQVQNATCDCISAGCTILCLDNVTVRYGRYGVGGQVGGGNAYSWVTIGTTFMAYGCVTGLGDVLDGFFTNLFLSYNTTGANFTSASGGIQIAGGRVEWNTTDGIQIACADVMCTSVLFDRNYNAGVYLASNYMATFSGCEFKRNGRNQNGSSCQVRFNAASNVTFSGCTSRYGADDGGGGVNTPAIWAIESGSGSTNIGFTGNDLTGTTSTLPQTLASFFSGTLPTNFRLTDNLGLLMDERNDARPYIRGGFPVQDYYENDVAASATITNTFYHDPLASFTCESFAIRLTVRDSTSGSTYVAEFRCLIDREGSTPTITASAAVSQIGTASYIAWGSGTINLSWTTIATDGSSYVLSIHNTSGTDSHHVRVQILT